MRPETRARWSFRLAVLGTALLLGSIAFALVLVEAGPAYSLWETPPAPTAEVTPLLGYFGTVGLPDGYNPGWVFVPGVDEYVAADSSIDYGGLLIPVNPGLTRQGPIIPVCGGEVDSLYFPGNGTTVYVGCQPGPNGTFVKVVNLSAPVPRNISLGTHEIPTQYALDAADQALFLTYYTGNAAGLLSLDLATDAVTANVSLPGHYQDLLYFDGDSGRLLAGDFGNSTVLSVAPSTGSTTPVLRAPGNVTGIFGDPRTDRLFVGYGSWTSLASGGIEVLNATSLDPIATLQLTTSGVRLAFPDAPRGEVEFTDELHVWLFNESTNQVVEAGGSLYLGPTYLTGFDPATDQFATVLNGCSGAPGSCLYLYNLSRSYTTPVPLSAVPYFGTNTPLAIGVLGFITAAVLLVVRSTVFYPVLDESAFSDPSSARDAPQDAALAESARQRWLAEDARRVQRKP